MFDEYGGPRPSFQRPPVGEVALAVEFEPLADLRIDELALVAAAFRDEYPVYEERPTKPPMSLTGDPAAFDITFAGTWMPPLMWFRSQSGDRLVQFQWDRLVANWVRAPGEEYPRYEATVRPMLERCWATLVAVLGELERPIPAPRTCEVIYVNPIDLTSDGSPPHQVSDLVAPWSGAFSDGFLPEPIGVRVDARFEIPDDLGSLNINVTPTSMGEGSAAVVLQLLARGRPKSQTFESALEWLDVGRNWVVRGFRSFTTPTMHDVWGIDE